MVNTYRKGRELDTVFKRLMLEFKKRPWMNDNVKGEKKTR